MQIFSILKEVVAQLAFKKKHVSLLLIFCMGVLASQTAIAQGRPPLRRHTVNQKNETRLVPADRKLSTKNLVTISTKDGYRLIKVNGIPEHQVGAFPNRGNPNRIREKSATFRVTLEPKQNEKPTPIRLGLNFGIGINGILFDPGAAEFFNGNPRAGWQYEALGGAINLGLDENFAHVQPDGKYHYHGLPAGLLKKLKLQQDSHSPLAGWAADGFPIYALLGYSDPKDQESLPIKLEPSYRLKQGKRPGKDMGGPGGTFDGTFVNDYEYVEGLGDLDECNGRFCITPEFPEGTYAYFLTHQWPSVPRSFKGTPDPSFQMRQGSPAGRQPPGRPGPGGRRFRPPPPRGR